MNETFLIINTSYFGDTLLTSNLIQNIKHNHPNSQIIFIANAPFTSVAWHLAGVDHVLAYDKKGMDQGVKGVYYFYQQYKYFFAKLNLVAAFVIYGNERGILLAKLWGAKKIYSDNAGLINCLVNNPRKINYPNIQQVAERHSYLYNFFAPNKLTNYPMTWEFKTGEKERGEAILREHNLTPKQKLIALCPLSKKVAKDLPVKLAGEIIKKLHEQGYTTLLLGTGKAVKYYAKTLHNQQLPFVSLVNETNLIELAAILSSTNGLISVDTGTMHLGLAIGIPTTCLFFINEPDHIAAWAPSENMYKCKVLVKPIEVNNILEATYELLNK